jgi:hypothetical protein
LGKPHFRPGDAIAKIADKGVQNATTAGKILLDLAAGETALVVDGMKKVVPLPVAAGTVANVVRHRVVTFIDLQKHLLETAAAQTHEVAESYREGKGLKAGSASVAELARKGIESFVEAEKKFLDLAAQEVTAAIKAKDEGRKPAPERYKVLTELARESGEKYIDAQKKLLNLAIEQLESAGKGTGVDTAHNGTRTTWGQLTEKSVRNLVTAQKSLMDLVAKPVKASPTDRRMKAPRVRSKRKVERVEVQGPA